MWKEIIEKLETIKLEYPFLKKQLKTIIDGRKKASMKAYNEGEALNLVYYQGIIDFFDNIKKTPYEITNMNFRLFDIDDIGYFFNFVIRNCTTNYLIILKTGKYISHKDEKKWEEYNLMSQYIENPIIVLLPEDVDFSEHIKKFTDLNFHHSLPKPFATDKNVLIAQSYMGQCCSYKITNKMFETFINKIDKYDNIYAIKKNYDLFNNRLALHFVPDIERKRWEILKKKLTPVERPLFIISPFQKQLGEAFFLRSDVYTENNHLSKDSKSCMYRIFHSSMESFSLYRIKRKDSKLISKIS